MKKIKIVETGYDACPGVFVFKEDEKNLNKIKIESSIFAPSKYGLLTKAQCKRLGKFLIDFGNSK